MVLSSGFKFSVRSILKELELSRGDVVDWARENIPWIVYDQEFYGLRDWESEFEEMKPSHVITWSTVKFRYLLMFYLMRHNFIITGGGMVMTKKNHEEMKKQKNFRNDDKIL